MQILLVLLLFGGMFGLSSSAEPVTPLTVGFVPGPAAIVREAAEAQAFADLLAARLKSPVQLRSFDSEQQLHQWLSRYREVDCGWFGNQFLAQLPAGEVLPLVAAESAKGGELPGRFVARQGIEALRLQQLREALLAFGGLPAEAALLSAQGVNRLVAAGELPRQERPVASAVAAPAAGLPLPAGGAVISPQKPQDLPVTLAADQLDHDQAARTFQARGKALLQQGGTTLAADALFFQESTRDAVASGQVLLTDPEGELRGDRAQANLGTGLGRVSDGRLFLRERNFHLAGDEIERLGEATYRVSNGRFTTCDGEKPDWQFSADQVDVTLGRFAVARDVWFEVGDQPLLYLPYLAFPVGRPRESGFLLPRGGYSSRKGAMLSLAWYEVIDRHLDATVYVDYLSKLGLGTGLEYRYVLPGDNRGEALYYHVSGLNDAPDSFAFDWRHDGRLPGNVRLAADVEYVSKREFFEDFGETAEEYTRDQTVSALLMQRNWEKLNLTGYGRYIKDLENDNDATLQRLPEFGLDVPFYRLDGHHPLYTRTALRATSFWREEGEDGERLFLRQGLGLVLRPGSWLEFSPEVAVYGRAYHADSDDEADLLPEYSATLSTRLVKVYPFARWGIERLQHSIEPQIRYLYRPNEDQEDLPDFDLLDRLEPSNLVEYALVNRLTARTTSADGAPVYRELLNLRLSQAYDIREERDDALDDPEPFSDLRAELTLNPTAGSFLSLDTYTRVYDDLKFSRLNASAGLDDGRGNLARMDYTYRGEELPTEATDYLGVQMESSLLAPVYLRLEERYDFREAESLESVVGLEYRAKCWSLFLTFRDRPDSQEVLVGFALSGLGQVGGFGSQLRPFEQ